MDSSSNIQYEILRNLSSQQILFFFFFLFFIISLLEKLSFNNNSTHNSLNKIYTRKYYLYLINNVLTVSSLQACFPRKKCVSRSQLVKESEATKWLLTEMKIKIKSAFSSIDTLFFFFSFIYIYILTQIIQMIDESLQSIREFRYTAFQLIVNICIKNRYCYELLSIYCCSMHIAGSYMYIHYTYPHRIHHHLLCLMLNVHVDVSWDVKGWRKHAYSAYVLS